ncbi:MAG: threonine-phosphate decarboxylase [Bacteroides sp.]|nr:threonine-phosphate decarboxylase [Bacteroides sp.]
MIDGHGDDLHRYGGTIVSNFSSNVYNHTDYTALHTYLSARLHCIHAYPEPTPLRLEQLLAERLGLESTQLCVTNGATEAIYLVAQAFAGKTSAVWMPTFSEYADACQVHGQRVRAFYHMEALPSDADLVWICNPNNPTGETRPLKQLIDLIDAHPQKLFILDQSYEYFTLKEVLKASDAVNRKNVLIVHSMTKQYAIPGLRIGYLLGDSGVLDDVRHRRMPWSVNALAIEAGSFLLTSNDFVLPDPGFLISERERLQSSLKATGMVEVWPSDTHFFLLRLRMGRASALKEYLATYHGILIRDASNFEGLDDSFVRIAVQTPPENDRLVEALTAWSNPEEGGEYER